MKAVRSLMFLLPWLLPAGTDALQDTAFAVKVGTISNLPWSQRSESYAFYPEIEVGTRLWSWGRDTQHVRLSAYAGHLDDGFRGPNNVRCGEGPCWVRALRSRVVGMRATLESTLKAKKWGPVFGVSRYFVAGRVIDEFEPPLPPDERSAFWSFSLGAHFGIGLTEDTSLVIEGHLWNDRGEGLGDIGEGRRKSLSLGLSYSRQ